MEICFRSGCCWFWRRERRGDEKWSEARGILYSCSVLLNGAGIRDLLTEGQRTGRSELKDECREEATVEDVVTPFHLGSEAAPGSLPVRGEEKREGDGGRRVGGKEVEVSTGE